MENVLYAEVNLMSAAMLLLLTFHMLSFERTQTKRLLANVFLSEVLFFVSDALYVFIEGSELPPACAFACNSLYFVCSVYCPFAWTRYVYVELTGNKLDKKSWYFSIPFLFVSLLAVTAPFKGLLFTIAEGNKYVRGPFYPVQPVVSAAYLIFSSCIAFHAGKKALSHDQRRKAKVLGTFVYFPLWASLLDVLTDGIPFVCPITTIALVFVYISLQRSTVTKDALTGINNRYEFQRYMDARRHDRDEDCWVFMLDIDKFKHINDTVGHLEGDRTLRRIAAVLSELAGKRDFFVARYGGDEFVAVGACRDEREAESLRLELKSAVRSANAPGDLFLTISAGKAPCRFGEGWEASVHEADKKLYEDKRLRVEA